MSSPAPVMMISTEAPTRVSAHEILRAATATAHAAVDHMVNVDAAWTIDRYRRFLRGLHAALAPLTAAFGRWLDRDRFPLLLTASSRLEGDLAAVGGRVPPASAAVPPVVDEAAAWGAAYVVLGSHLGGPFIARAVRGPLCLAPEHLTYLTPDAPVAAEWRRFLTDLEQWHAGSDDAARQRCSATALAVFAAVESALAGEGLQ